VKITLILPEKKNNFCNTVPRGKVKEKMIGEKKELLSRKGVFFTLRGFRATSEKKKFQSKKGQQSP